MTDIETVKMLSGNDEISDDLVAFFMESTRQFILSYCNISEIPDALRPTFLEMSTLKLKANTSGATVAVGEGLKSVASISDGNQSISYQAGATGGKQFSSEEDFVAAFGNVLDRFRRMKVDSASCTRTCGSRCLHKHANDSGW